MPHHYVEVCGRRFEAVGPAEFAGKHDGVAVWNEYLMGTHNLPDGVPAVGLNGEELTKVSFYFAGGNGSPEEYPSAS